MIVYLGTKKSFMRDATNGVIAGKLDELFISLGIGKESDPEYKSWAASLPRLGLVLAYNSSIDNDVAVALEYQIPLTSKRVDFMIGGSNEDKDNVVIVELKQWTECKATDKENVVSTFINHSEKEVVHPSQQAYSYAKLIENFNEDVRNEKINMIPCAYLHNFEEKYKSQILDPRYKEALDDAPVFLQKDSEKLSDFIAKYISKPSKKNLFDIIENGKLKPSKSLQDSIGSLMNGNKEFEMIDEQQVAYATILKLVEKSIDSEEKHTIIVQGGAGTGKSVIALNLLAKIINNGYSCVYVTKNIAPRYTFQNNLIKGKHSISFLKGLFKGSGSFVDVKDNVFDCILTDEAHRLRRYSGLFGNLGENQVKEIIKASKISVFFIDEDQRVTMSDIGTVEEIKKQAAALGSKVHCGNSLHLVSQFRCNGSNGYIAFLDDFLGISKAASYTMNIDYDLRVFDDPCKMREELRKYNVNNKARMIAGYCYPWNSKNDKTQIDICLSNGFKAQWNFTTESFATDLKSFEQVGCIHSTQGLEFEYVGIIIGKDLQYKDGKVITDYHERYLKTDKSIINVRTPEDKAFADMVIRNTYKTLLSRGLKGCFVYCEDDALRKYLKETINNFRAGEKVMSD